MGADTLQVYCPMGQPVIIQDASMGDIYLVYRHMPGGRRPLRKETGKVRLAVRISNDSKDRICKP